MANLWNYEKPVSEYGIKIPRFIDDGFSPADVAAVLQGGCSSGAYMPAVTYWQALETMNEHGDEVLQFIEDMGCDIAEDEHISIESWAGLACDLVSLAVELWCIAIEDELTENIEEKEQWMVTFWNMIHLKEPAAFDLTRVVLANDVVTSVPWDKRRVIKRGTVVFVIPASNLSADAKIKYWVMRVEGNSDCGIVSDVEGPYGVGLYHDDVV